MPPRDANDYLVTLSITTEYIESGKNCDYNYLHRTLVGLYHIPGDRDTCANGAISLIKVHNVRTRSEGASRIDRCNGNRINSNFVFETFY